MDQSNTVLEERLAAVEPDLTPTERRVANFLVAHRAEVVILSAADIAARLDTSDASVIRTVQALGYAGVPELKRELVESLRSRPTPALRLGASLEQVGSNPAEALDHVISVQMELLQAARETVAINAFMRAVDVLRNAHRILVYGVGLQAPLADYAVLRLRRFRRQARPITRTREELADELLDVLPGDALLAMAYAPLSADCEVVLNRARSVGVPVVLLTDVLAAAVADRVTVALSARRGRSDEWSTIGTSLVLVEALVLGLAASDREGALDALAALDELRAQLAH